jgi:hypothetical protein
LRRTTSATLGGRERSGDHHVVPAGAIERVDHGSKTVTLEVTAEAVHKSPKHEDPEVPVDWGMINQFERGMLGGGFVWPYTDV